MGIRLLRKAKLREYQKATLVSASPPLRYGAACGARSRRGQKQLATLRFDKQVFALIRLALRSSAHPQGDPEYPTAEYQYPTAEDRNPNT